MVTTYTMDLFKDPFFIGFNDMFDRLNTVHTMASHQSYPPYNIVKVEDDVFRVDLALAGFDKKDVDVTVDNGTLDRKSTRLNSSHSQQSRMPSSA